MTRRWIVLLLLLMVGVTAVAQQPATPEDPELAELLNVLEEETELATKTRMNSDFVPGIVTVLHADELEALGVATAGEALKLVPGMQAALDARGNATVLVRGIDFPFNSGNIQILINSIPLTRADAGINASALLIPIQQIERIEVIRGPGSVLYGDFAFMGLVNVVTRSAGSAIAVRVNSNDIRTGTGRFALKKSGWETSSNLSRIASEKTPTGDPRAAAEDDQWIGVFGLRSGGFSLSAQGTAREYDNLADTAGVLFDETSWTVDGRYARELSRALRAESHLTFMRTDIDNLTSALAGDVVEGGADVIWKALPRHEFLFGAEYSRSTIDEAFHTPPPVPGRPPSPRTRLVASAHRNVFALTAQDRVDLTDRFSVTLGARYDSYSDLDNRVTPRASLVWRLSDRHIIKGQYAEGFRPPTFFELYSPPANITPRYPFEVNATTELNYVYRGTGRVGRATVYSARIRDMIRPGGVVTVGQAEATGVELEWAQQLTSRLKVDTNLSHVDTVDPRVLQPGDQPNPIAGEWLGNVSVLFQPFVRAMAGVQWNHVGDRSGGDGYDQLDLSIAVRDLFVRGLDIRAGLKNAFDDEVRYLTARPNGEIASVLAAGRSVWIKVAWRMD